MKALHEGLGMISTLLVLVNLHATFTMLSLCYAQHVNYLLHIVFPSLGILQLYAKFDSCTIIMLEKLFGARFFGGSIDHPICHQAIFPISSNEHNLPFIVQITAPTFLGCWVLITPTLIIRFQQDYHPILLDVITHVEIGISPF